mmetsp:Transcript_46831/g.111424  ORF Transcript_46831/g.111424 Transcript_46831/m.111424 type:complete len:117 (+) Transcript_46831:106-456(+)
MATTATRPETSGGQIVQGTADLAGTRLQLPAFEWYLGPMYQRYNEILAEREKAKNTIVTTKKVVAKLPTEPAWVKHVTPRSPVHRFAGASRWSDSSSNGSRPGTAASAPSSARSRR